MTRAEAACASSSGRTFGPARMKSSRLRSTASSRRDSFNSTIFGSVSSTRPMVALAYRGASSPRLRTDPSNLIRVMPAKGAHDNTEMFDDRGLRFRGRGRDPGRPEVLRGGGLLRGERDRGADGAEHTR